MKKINYKGKGEHCINELEKIIEQREEELHLIKSGQVVLNLPCVMPQSEQLNSFCLWYKTTDFNCEGNSPEDCVTEYLKTI